MSKRIHWSLILCLVSMLLFFACITPDNPLDPGGAAATDDPQQIITIVTDPPVNDQQKAEAEKILKRLTFLDGITVDGISIGGMTTEEAKLALADALQKAKADFSVSFTSEEDTVVLTGETIALTDNLDEILSDAFNLVREDKGYEAILAEVEQIRTNKKEYRIEVSFDRDALEKTVQTYAGEHGVPAVNASVSYNKDSKQLEYTDDTPGRTIDVDALVAALLAAKSGETLEAPVVEQAAEITRENVESKFVLRASKTTSFKGSTENRKFNVRKGAGLITGTLLHPGEIFSCNEKLGTRNKSNGWKLAGAYQSGETVQEYGGGVCQLSSTLYNAVVMADLEVVDRRNHSMKVSYIGEGLDATINSVGNIIDFKFKNSSRSDILIVAFTVGNDLTFNIYGIPIAEDSDGEYDSVKISKPKKIRTLSPSGEVETVIDESKPVGFRQESKKRQNGSVWQTFKQYYKGDTMVREEELAISTYKAFAGQIILGPAGSSEESPVPTEKPSDTEKPVDTPKPSDTPAPVETPKPTDTPAPTKEPDPTEPPNPGGGD